MHKQPAISRAWGTHPVVGLGRKDFFFFSAVGKLVLLGGCAEGGVGICSVSCAFP